MPSNWPWSLPERNNSSYTKSLEGIQSTPKLTALIQARLKDAPGDASSSDSFFTMKNDEAKTILKEHEAHQSPQTISLDVVRALYTLSISDAAQQELNSALTNSTKLTFTAPPLAKSETTGDKRFQKRMDRLRLRAEEVKYQKLTDSLGHVKQDDVTVRSMTYAASVGLNMIVAPISFGVFMYFFAGQIFSWLSTNDDEPSSATAHDAVDIKRVIAGVVSGVMMLFIEMILFVIRTHTMEKYQKSNNKKKTPSPFGYSRPKEGTAAAEPRIMPKY